MSTRLLIITLVLLPLLAYILNEFQKGTETPPPPLDFGSGYMFDQIANRYDFINRVLALRMDVGWRKRMTAMVRHKLHVQDSTTTKTTPPTTATNLPPLRILDVATGTADVALQLARDLPPSTTIWGIDPSVNMLEVGRHKIAQQGFSNRITLLTGDVRELSSSSSAFLSTNNNNNGASKQKEESQLFDAVTMAFGIRNVPERAQALCEIHSLLKPGGVLAILEFSEPDASHGFLGHMARFFIRYIVPVLGAALSGAPREYVHLQNSIKEFPLPETFRNDLQTLVCHDHAHTPPPHHDNDNNGSSTTRQHAFDMDDVIHMNFGSVQLYIGTAVKPPPPKEEQEKPASILDFIQHEIKHHDVVIFSKSYCPYCRAAKSLFRDTIGISNDKLKIHELDELPNGAAIQATLKEWTGQATVPNIFIRGHHVGGNDAVQQAHREGTLDTLLQVEAGAAS